MGKTEKSAIAIVVSDTHLSERTTDINKSIFNQVLDIAIGLNVKIVIHGGDVFDSRKGQPEIVLNTFNDILNEFNLRDVKLVAIAGNHDRTSYVSEDSFLIPFDNHVAFELINPYGMISIGGVNIILLPYYDEKLKYREMLEETYKFIDPEFTNILVTHVGIDEAKTNGGRKLESAITHKQFAQFDTVLVGHYHDRQFVGENIFYIGSAYQANFGENDEKGCVVIYNDGSMDMINLEFPRFVNHNIDVKELTPELVKQIQASPANHKLKISGKITKENDTVISELDKIGVMMETVTESFDPVKPQIKANIQLTQNDIVDSLVEWGDLKKIEDIDYGVNLLLENKT